MTSDHGAHEQHHRESYGRLQADQRGDAEGHRLSARSPALMRRLQAQRDEHDAEGMVNASLQHHQVHRQNVQDTGSEKQTHRSANDGGRQAEPSKWLDEGSNQLGERQQNDKDEPGEHDAVLPELHQTAFRIL